jgi:hypothetical protein
MYYGTKVNHIFCSDSNFRNQFSNCPCSVYFDDRVNKFEASSIIIEIDKKNNNKNPVILGHSAGWGGGGSLPRTSLLGGFKLIHPVIKVHRAWAVAKLFPVIRVAAKYLIDLCAIVRIEDEKLLCDKCGMFYFNIIEHILFSCDLLFFFLSITVFTVFRLLTDFVCLYNYEF